MTLTLNTSFSTPSPRSLTLLAALFSAAALVTACGGGGGDSTTATTPAPAPVAVPTPVATPPAPAAGTLRLTVPMPTYAATAPELALFNQLNAERSKGGYGMLAQSTSLDDAARKHANYLLTNFYKGNNVFDFSKNPTGSGHLEDPSFAGFTGVTSIDRARAAGYPTIGITGENVGFESNCVTGLLNTVYHRNSMLDTTMSEVGIALVKASDGVGTVCVVVPGFPNFKTPLVAPSGWVGVYPQDAQTGIATIMSAESPNPLPDVLVKGYPFSVTLAARNPLDATTLNTLGVTTFTLSDSKGNLVQSRLMLPTAEAYAAGTGSSLSSLDRNSAYLIPTQALASNTTYTVQFVGVANGVALSRTWSVTTK